MMGDRIGRYRYDIHGIVTINSNVVLPELQRFRAAYIVEDPTLSVVVGLRRPTVHARPTAGRISYSEVFRRLGFSIDIAMDDRVEIYGAPLLRYSPHVLYTNVVEPVLRWTFVRRGWALVHAAAFSFGGDAYFITGRPDTGKTTTLLRILDAGRGDDAPGFISDDLVLLAADGRVLTYPKPLTIGRHTATVLSDPRFSRRERLMLRYQSRVHSRGGRSTALGMSRSRMPIATINAVVQMLVPPPKYDVQRLVPHARLTQTSHLAGMFIIERGGEGVQLIAEHDALTTLLANGDDAYGFPPYDAIKEFLYTSGSEDLREREREIVAGALRGVPTRFVRSSQLDWSDRIPTMTNATIEATKGAVGVE